MLPAMSDQPIPAQPVDAADLPPPLEPAAARRAEPVAYATPAGIGPERIYRRGMTLVTPTLATLPPICVKTGDAGDDVVMKEQTFTWYPPLILLLFFLPLGLFILIIVYLVTKKTARVRFGVRQDLLRRRTAYVCGGVFTLFAGLAVAVVGPVFDQLWLVAVGAVIFITGAVVAAMGGRILYPRKITHRQAELGGASEAFFLAADIDAA